MSSSLAPSASPSKALDNSDSVLVQLDPVRDCRGLVGRKLDSQFPQTRQLGAKHALWILSLINLLNFADRYVPSAVKQLIENDLKINDFESSVRHGLTTDLLFK
jgi:hypothetical protein